jgi:phosphomethylpyrimidine synthase
MNTEEKISEPRLNSKKVYIDGNPPIKVAMRETLWILNYQWQNKKNPPVTVYDTSGPFTDPS